MAAVYAAVVSIVHLMDQIQSYHARRPIFLDEQLKQLENIQQIVIFLQDFLEVCPHESIEEAEGLRIQIRVAAYAVEYIIESHIVDDIHSQTRQQYIEKKMNEKTDHVRSTNYWKRSSDDFSQRLQRVIEDMEDIKREVKLFKEKLKLEDHQPRDLAPFSPLGRPHFGKDTTMEFDDNFVQIMEELTKGQSSLQIIPIVGTSGIGKSTLAKNIYDNEEIVKHFDFRGWITISQTLKVRDMLLCLLHETEVSIHKSGKQRNDHQLGQQLHKRLSCRRYLIIVDDFCDAEIWEELTLFFPENDNGSRIIVTTRQLDLCYHFGYFNVYWMNLLTYSESWTLLCKMIFFPKDCPPELEEVGKKIAERCEGLPLSIVVIGGLLANSNMTCAYWETIADDISMIMEFDDHDRTLSILSLIYNHLPIHLKSCFLYTGVYIKDQEIRVSELIKLWVAEGFLKPHRAKTMEEVANDYLNDLIDRNLIFVTKFGSTGNKKYCKIHYMVSGFCYIKAQKERVLRATKVHSPNTSQKMNNQHRVFVPLQVLRALHSKPIPRSFTCNFECDWPQSSIYFKLPRDMNTTDSYSEELQLVNSRYLSYLVNSSALTPSLYLWNLQTLIISKPSSYITNVPFEIWEMLQLRHLNIVGVTLSDPPCQMGKVDAFVLENLQSLSLVRKFRCTEEALKRLPNIKKLKIFYPESRSKKELSHYCLNNLGHLNKLQSLYCSFRSFNHCPTQNLNFPDSLKKLTLKEGNFDGEGIIAKIGSLPHLEKLVLISCYIGKEWNPIEQQFLSLRSLEIYDDDKLVEWTADSTHFPCLECLVCCKVSKLKEIPSGFGEIETLRSIKLTHCRRSAITSAKEILKVQQSLGNVNFILSHDEEDDDDDEL